MKGTLPEIARLGLYDAGAVHKNRTVTPPRLVSLYEIEFVIEDGGVSHIGDKAYALKKNSVIVAKPGQTRHTELPFRSLFVHLLCEDSDICAILEKAPDFSAPENFEQYRDALMALIEASTSALPESAMELYEKLFLLLSLIAKNSSMLTAAEKGKSNAAVIKKALEYIDAHFCENITLRDIAREVHLSRIYFRSIFLCAVGSTPYDYIKSLRLSKAKQLIISSDKPFSQIALECGFSSQSYMNAVFRKELGVTPKQFKEETSLMV